MSGGDDALAYNGTGEAHSQKEDMDTHGVCGGLEERDQLLGLAAGTSPIGYLVDILLRQFQGERCADELRGLVTAQVWQTRCSV